MLGYSRKKRPHPLHLGRVQVNYDASRKRKQIRTLTQYFQILFTASTLVLLRSEKCDPWFFRNDELEWKNEESVCNLRGIMRGYKIVKNCAPLPFHFLHLSDDNYKTSFVSKSHQLFTSSVPFKSKRANSEQSTTTRVLRLETSKFLQVP